MMDLPELELSLGPDGTPQRPLVVLPLEPWRAAGVGQAARAAAVLAQALPVTVGLLSGAPTASLRPLLDAVTLTLCPADALDEAAWRTVVGVADVAGAATRLQAAAGRAPRAAVACGQLLRQTAVLPSGAGLAAEAATYSTLLGGPEFARWLAGRGEPRHQSAAAGPLVQISRDGARLSVRLDDPGRRNALSSQLREDLLAALDVAEADESISEVELTGAGLAFCSGGDLDEFGRATDLAAAYLVRLARAPWRVLDRISGRVTARVHGACIGAGTELAAFSGRVVAAPDAFFALPEVSMGLVPGAGGSVSVPRRIGRWRAGWLMLTGERLLARDAVRWGLADELARPAGG